MVKKPNILYLHSHDTGRFLQPYGQHVLTPNIQRLADQGLLFRKAFCAAPTCSGSRSALLTGQYPHANGMMGLAHRGFKAGPANGTMNETTATALKAFQKSEQIAVTGRLNPRTLSRLGIDQQSASTGR